MRDWVRQTGKEKYEDRGKDTETEGETQADRKKERYISLLFLGRVSSLHKWRSVIPLWESSVPLTS